MKLRIVGAGLPRTGTSSLAVALEQMLGGRSYHMSTIPGHPFDLGTGWNQALAGDTPDWDQLFDGYVAAVDWPASMFWRELSDANPNALVHIARGVGHLLPLEASEWANDHIARFDALQLKQLHPTTRSA